MGEIPETLIWGLLVGGLLILGGLAVRMIFAPETAQDKEALSRIKQMRIESAHDTATALVLEKRRVSIGRDWPLIGNPQLLVRRAGLEGHELPLVIGTGAGGFLLGAVLSFLTLSVLAFPAGFATAVFLMLTYLKSVHKRRADALTRQLPDALDLMMRGLRVGHPISATIANVGRTMADPVGAEFRILAEQISHGDYLRDAFEDMAERIGQEDVDYLSVSISIQHGTGGNLAEMLETLSKVVRDRIIMRRRVRAISSEGRMSAYLLSALPVLIYVTTSISAPDYYGGVSDDPLFQPIAFAIVALVIANFLALRKLVSFEI